MLSYRPLEPESAILAIQRFRNRVFLSSEVGVTNMEWTKPSFEEVCLNCEINSYASAKL
jgi:coenzyme PQQ precursor peptide PqqA